MNELMILSTSFVSLMSTINFSSLRLDNFIQLLDTSSVVLGLEFVFSIFCMLVSENVLSLSLQESPNLFTFRVASQSFLGARNFWTKWANNGSHRSIMTDWRRQTGRQAFFFRVIGLSSARVKERLADGDVIVVEVIGAVARPRTPGCIRHKPLWWSGPWAHNLWEARSRPGCPGPQRKCAGYLSSTSWKLKVSGSRNSMVIREMMRKEKKWMEASKRSRNSTHNEMTHVRAMCDECEREPMQCAIMWIRKKQSRDADTNNKEERLQKQTSSALVQSTTSTSHWMYLWVSSCFSSFYMLLCLSLCISCHQIICCQCTKLIHFLTCTGNPCRDSHFENGLVRCCLYKKQNR